MNNFHFLLTAWIVVWAAFFGYEISVSARVARLRDEIDHLKDELREG